MQYEQLIDETQRHGLPFKKICRWLPVLVALVAAQPPMVTAHEPVMAESAITFKSNSTELGQAEQQEIAAYLLRLKAMKICPLREIWVIGYADPSEGVEVAQRQLSVDRARQVAEALRSYGAPASVIHDGFGGTEGNNRVWRGFWGGYVEIHVQQPLFTSCDVPEDANGYFPEVKR